ncbi:hypothetical protein THAOC_05307, partial [Thalassiosira oceanica]
QVRGRMVIPDEANVASARRPTDGSADEASAVRLQERFMIDRRGPIDHLQLFYRPAKSSYTWNASIALRCQSYEVRPVRQVDIGSVISRALLLAQTYYTDTQTQGTSPNVAGRTALPVE